jgi:peptidoglycan/xylan/chitin deacetylase (PgdA/CDA1 family)/glycosyltransferase involved in cell wall biosynthesis
VTPGPVELSILIPSRDRRERLRRCLESLRRQTLEPGRFEVIVGIDGSRDGSAEMAEALETAFSLRVLRLDREGKAQALNRCLEQVSGSACLFLDDDLVASPELAAEHLAVHGSGRVLAIGRLTQAPPTGSDPYAEASARAWNERYDRLADGAVDWADCYGANFSAPTGALREVGGFAVGLPAAEDLEAAFRLSQAGCEPRYLPRAEALHDDGKPGERVLADQERFGAVAARFAAERPAMRRRLLGWFSDTTPREITLRLVLIRLGVPSRWLAAAGRLVPGAGPRWVWFGFVARYAFWRGVRSAMSRGEWAATVRGTPILMYHAFADGGRGSRFVQPARRFAAQMWLLRILRYRVIELEELAAMLQAGTIPPRRTAVLTIDDGYRDNLAVASPILRRHRFPATVFLVSARIGAGNDWEGDGTVAGRPLMSLEEVRRMARSGASLGAHSRTHPALPEITDGALEAEVAGSRSDLERVLGAPVTTFAFPYGRYDDRAVAAVRRAGFEAACTALPRPARPGDDPMLLPRIEVGGTDPAWRFLRKLWFGDTR